MFLTLWELYIFARSWIHLKILIRTRSKATISFVSKCDTLSPFKPIRKFQEYFSACRRNSYLTSFNNLAEIPLAVQLKCSMYLCWFSGMLQSMLGTQSLMKCGRSRPMVYFAMSVVKTVQAAPKPNTPICVRKFYVYFLNYKEIKEKDKIIYIHTLRFTIAYFYLTPLCNVF